MKTINEATFSNLRSMYQRELLEMDMENMIFDIGYWCFGYINHQTETLQFQVNICNKCGNYETDIYIQRIKCNCNENHQNPIEYSFFDSN